ncbi:hypothetical protein [Candidatus Uabimicrobium sp. HlEnr_7]|uniref:hypothetical protein n=1 Tax=Candidatus Uabimicrobium helgolandensis TaxID=3095367 RepID=UPI00355699CA
MQQDNKIFIYLRLQDEKDTLLKSRIREFAALGKLLVDFVRQCWEEYGQWILKTGTLEYVDANTGIVLLSFRYDLIHGKLIISGLIPKNYQKRMLDLEETKNKLPASQIVEHISQNLSVVQKDSLRKRIAQPLPNVLALIKERINNNGEYYIAINLHHVI